MRRSKLPGIIVAALAATALTVVTTSAAPAATTVSPTQAGSPQLVRDSTVTVSVDRTAMTYYRGSASAAFAPQGGLSVAAGLLVCRGDNPTGTNNSPRTTVVVTAPDGSTVSSSLSPARDMGASGFLTQPTHQPLAAPVPSNTAYRGDLPDAGAFHGLKSTIDLAGKPAGIYTVTTTHTNKVKTGLFGACATGTPVSNGNGGFTNAAPTAGNQVETQTFEYRPWQADFIDVLGAGKVSANITPAEFTFSIGAKKAAVLTGGVDAEQRFYSLPAGTFALPSDPAACTADPSSCLPATAQECAPGNAACTPRLMLVSKPSNAASDDAIQGVFDLQTKAFIALAKVGGTTRLLMSLGTQNDAIYDDVLANLAASAKAGGIDLASILATEVTAGNEQQTVSLSLLNGLQIDPSTTPGGVQIATDATVQAGIVLHVNSSLRLSGGACVANSGGSAQGTRQYSRKEPTGYKVATSDLLPAVPGVGPLGALTGGPVWSIKGVFGDDALVNTASAVIGADTSAGEPNGYPVRIQPFVSGIHTAKPKTMEFVGTGTWSASETPVGQGCLTVNLLVGTGVAVYNNPLPVGLGTILDPLTVPNPGVLELTQAVTEAVDQATSSVTSDPTIAALLDQLVGGLPLGDVPLG